MGQRIMAFFIIWISFLNFAQATSSDSVTVCYQDLREELVTAALLTGQQKDVFKTAGIQINWVKNVAVPQEQRKALVSNSNFDEKASEYYYHGNLEEVALLQSAESHKCDFISTTFEAVVAAKIDLSKIEPMAVYQYGQGGYDTHLVVRKDSKIKSIADLKGKKVRVNQIGSLLPFENMLKSAGLSPQDVQYVKVSLANLPKALDKQRVDAVLSYNPTIPLLIASERVRILETDIFSKFYGQGVPHSLLVVRKKFAASQPAIVTKFMKAFSTAALSMSQNPESMIYSVPHVSSSYSNAQIEKSISNIKIGTPLLATEMPKESFLKEGHFAEYAKVLKEKAYIKPSSDLSAWGL